MHRRSPLTIAISACHSWSLVCLAIGLFGLLWFVTPGPPSHAQTIPPVTNTPTPVATAIATALSTSTPLPTNTATAIPQPTATSSPPPQLLISEFLADPGAVNDEVGEWFELYNADTVAVNLRGWTVADLDSDRHAITVDIVIQPGQYLVLARNTDTVINGGVIAAYGYSGLTLANSSDELLLLAPSGEEVDRVEWDDGTALDVQRGVSLERTTPNLGATWMPGNQPWPGSSGDWGTPGGAYQAPAGTPTQAAPPTTEPGATATQAATPPGVSWPLVGTASTLQIDEIHYRGSDEEFVVLVNTGAQPFDLTGWMIGDEETPGQGEGIYRLPAGRALAAGERIVIARNGAAFQTQWGQRADAEFDETDANTPTLDRQRTLASGTWALNDSGDEVILLTPNGEVADVVAFGNGDTARFGLSGELRASQSDSLQRVPDARFPTVREQRHRFLLAPPQPFTTITLPQPAGQGGVPLNDGLIAVWGSLGTRSTFSADGTVPPHYLQSAAAAHGLNFLAIADPTYITPWNSGDPISTLSAWRWQDDNGAEAVIYHNTAQPVLSQVELLSHLTAMGIVAQWIDGTHPNSAAIPALSADNIMAPGSLRTLTNAWRDAASPLLPAGNTNPPLPGELNPSPRYTGLAVNSQDSNAILAALTARRGWLTNRPGLWLTLRVEGNAGTQWMGTAMTAQNEVAVTIDYGDNQGDLAGLALWQDNRPLRRLDLPTGNQQWRVNVPALPNTFLYAVATQADGDFAVTAPIYVWPANDGRVILNEVLPAPWGDHNGDGEVNTDDEFIELYNPSDFPLSLDGWQLLDASAEDGTGRAFTFPTGSVINGKSWFILFRNQSYLSLNNENERVVLRNPAGEEVDRIEWAVNPGQGASLGRLPDGGSWQNNSPTPGNANLAFSEDRIAPFPTVTSPSNPPSPNNNADDDDDDDGPPPPIRLDPRHGQAGGPPASVAQSKLAGLEADVEFYAIVIAPPGLFNASIYVADPAPDPVNGPLAGIGIQIYLRRAGYPLLQEGDRVRVRGVLKSFRGEMEMVLTDNSAIQRVGTARVLLPLPITGAEVGESLEGRLVTFTGVVSGWQGDSIYLSDPTQPDAPATRVTVRSSTGWRRPYVNRGEVWEVTGIVSQFAREKPWNGGYRVLVRYREDLVRVE